MQVDETQRAVVWMVLTASARWTGLSDCSAPRLSRPADGVVVRTASVYGPPHAYLGLQISNCFAIQR
jgi:hypothetical protein